MRLIRKKVVRDEKRGASGASGYCCPKCHTWHPTPEKRRECRAEHVRAEKAEAARKEAA